MAYDQRSLDDYVDVATRIADFRERYPEGSLQPVNPAEPWRIVQAEGFDKDGTHTVQSFVVYVAAAYRTPGDPRPGIGAAWEIFPGRTNFTRGSELQNAETSAWGRAIVAVGASDAKAGIASREEVRNRQAEREQRRWSEGDVHPEWGDRPLTEKEAQALNNRAAGLRDDGLPMNKDSSLSRSRTTDEQKQAAGVMTSQQQADHTALQPKRKESRSPAQRLHERDPADPFHRDGLLDAAVNTYGPGPVDEAVEDRPGTATKEQIGSMHAAFARIGVPREQRDERLRVTNEILGLTGADVLHSATRLSYRQAGDLLVALEDRAKAGAK